ncbi:MAG: hypothetical protein K6C12_04535 [Oscillospiraceae bacterium]|nr:hypothetical protein [Oscillospiraceae bacterium]
MNKSSVRILSLVLAILILWSVPVTGFGYDDGNLWAEWTDGRIYGNRIYFSAASASSTLKEGNITFSAAYAIDDKREYQRPWVEGVRGDGIGETLTLYFDDVVTITALSLRLGYARDQARYDKNNRPSALRFTFSDGRSVESWFDDVNEEQSIILSDAVSTCYVKITILDVYEGTQCDDTCIYQVKAYELVG